MYVAWCCGGDKDPNKPNPPAWSWSCASNFLRSFGDYSLGENGYPRYARPNNGRTIEKNGFTYDNTRVVPYNPYLSAK